MIHKVIMKTVNLKTILMVPWVLATVQLIQTIDAGSCEEAKLCCSGRDSACVVQKTSPNAIIEGPHDKPCYCDHACIKLGDCCNDFKKTCGGKCFSVILITRSLTSHFFFMCVLILRKRQRKRLKLDAEDRALSFLISYK